MYPPTLISTPRATNPLYSAPSRTPSLCLILSRTSLNLRTYKTSDLSRPLFVPRNPPTRTSSTVVSKSPGSSRTGLTVPSPSLPLPRVLFAIPKMLPFRFDRVRPPVSSSSTPVVAESALLSRASLQRVPLPLSSSSSLPSSHSYSSSRRRRRRCCCPSPLLPLSQSSSWCCCWRGSETPPPGLRIARVPPRTLCSTAPPSPSSPSNRLARAPTPFLLSLSFSYSYSYSYSSSAWRN
mmetsp:Transcript_3886/g.11969  ORF Transcript_3886/g.11969 Transcript_3886/m.11969 type:complete len:237 (+) Transcript_3886:2615-3325(+)